MKWHTFSGYLFAYEDVIRHLYEEKRLNDTNFTPAKPDKSYYTFLRFFDWDNPPFFNNPSYPRMFQHILTDSILNIPSIDNLPFAEWMAEVKTIMSDPIGSNTGLFYDMLALHAYLKQLHEEVKPLHGRQMEDINKYFKNPTFAKFLFAENDATIKQSKLSSVIKTTPVVNKEQLMDVIVSQYKGKIVVVDFWATWCGPCLQAMTEIKPLKEELQGKNVVFVYIAETSSPTELWKKKILGIDGDHYYLSEEESKYIYNHFQIEGIPTYFIYDSTGMLKEKIVGFPGVEAIKGKMDAIIDFT